MRVMLISDASMTLRERSLLGRLEVGLADGGVQVIRAAPPLPTPLPPAGLAEFIQYEPCDWGFFASRLGRSVSGFGGGNLAARARRLVAHLEEIAASGAGGGPIDIVHAWGVGCWDLAFEVAWQADARIALEVWTGDLIDRLPRIERHDERGEGPPLWWIAPNESLRQAVYASGATRPCLLAPWGVHSSPEPTAWRMTDGPASIVMLSSGADPESLISALEGLAAAICTEPDVVVFLDAAAMRDHRRVWKALERLDLLERVSLIADVEGRRELILQADVLVQPELRGEIRSIILEAMSRGMTIVAQRHEWMSELVNDETALLVETARPAEWEDAFRRLLHDRAIAQSKGAAAHAVVRRDRPVSRHIEALRDIYHLMSSDESLPFSSTPENVSRL